MRQRGIVKAAKGRAQPRRFKLDDGGGHQHFYLLADAAGPGPAGVSLEQMARHITAKHCYFGKVELNAETFRGFVKNFDARTYGQDIQGDKNHRPEDGVTFTFRRLYTEGDRLLAEIEWTPLGIDAYHRLGLKYFSIDFTDDYVDPETGTSHGPLLFGAALTPRPFIKNMPPTQGPGRMSLSEGRTVVVPDYLKIEGVDMTLAELLAAIRVKLSEMKLSASVVTTLTKQFEETANITGIAGDAGKLKQLAAALEPEWKKLAAATTEPTKQGNQQLSEEAITSLVNKTLDARAQQQAKLSETAETRRQQFVAVIDGSKGLSDKTKELLKKQSASIGAEQTEAQVKTLAESAVELGNQLEVANRAGALGLQLSASGQIESIEVNGTIGSQVHGLMRERLLLSDNIGLKLPEEKTLSSFAQKILREFDRVHGARLTAEHKYLSAGGVTNISDGAFPVVAQRQVIVELLADLQFLALVQTIVDPQASVTLQIPYEVRNTSSVKNGAITYEGQPIQRAGVSQLMDISYITPRKIALLMSNEMIHFSRTAQINWDAWARNISSNARLMRDIIAAAIANEMQRSADAFEAAAVNAEAITPQVDGTRTLFKTAQFPVVRPKQVRDLQGTAVGAVECPLTLTIAAAARPEYDGSGTQAAGNYWQMVNWNLGLFQIVNQAGVVQTLADETAVVINYYKATNVEKFDIDVPEGVTNEKHLNGLLSKFGKVKAFLNQQRFVTTDFAVTSGTLHNTITDAEQFEESHQKEGTSLAATGDLGVVKSVPVWGTNQPGTDLGDERIIIGQRGTLSYGVAKPFVTGMPFEAIDSNGRPTGQKQAYGEEYSTIHVPLPIRNRLRSLIVYSASARAAI